MRIRALVDGDLEAIHRIYAHHVAHSLGTFETEPPDLREMQARCASIVGAGSPYVVAERDGRVLGYAYATQFRSRAAYRGTVEDSIYVAAGESGRGIGKALLGALVDLCQAQGLRQMLAFIGDSQNAASIRAHRACGFADVGVMAHVGRKLDRWVDVVIMQRHLRGSESEPVGP
ncbi:MAG: N-acetyltransferase family protein [Burkholderiaceae bacterium]